jgi:hypothetical protein
MDSASNSDGLQNDSVSPVSSINSGPWNEHLDPSSPPPPGSMDYSHTMHGINDAGQPINDTVQSLLRALSVRGTGNHICPYAERCTKGGMKDTHPVIFERNSAFR